MKAKIYSFSPAISIDQPCLKKEIHSSKLIGALVIVLMVAGILAMNLSRLQTASYGDQNTASTDISHTNTMTSATANGSENKLLSSYLNGFCSLSANMDSRLDDYRINNIKLISKNQDEIIFTSTFAVKPASNRSTWTESLGPIGSNGWTTARSVSIKAIRSGDNFSIKEMHNID